MSLLLYYYALQIPTSSLLLEILAASLLFVALFSVTAAMAVFCQIGEEKSLAASSFAWV